MRNSKIPKRMTSFFNLAALIVLSTVLAGCGAKTPAPSNAAETQQTTSDRSSYESNTVAMTSGESAPATGSEYDSTGSKVTFAPPSYRTAYSSTSSAFTTIYPTSSSATAESASSSQTYGTATIAYAGSTPAFRGVNVQTTDPVFHGAHWPAYYRCPNSGIYTPSACGNTVDPVFHGAHW